MENTPHRSTARALEILEFVAQLPKGATLTEIALHLQAPKSSIFPIIKTLNDKRYLNFIADNNRYTIGVKALEIGYSYIKNNDLFDEISSEMDYIVQTCGETCYFGQLNEGDVLYLLKADSPEAIRMVASAGRRLPAYATAIGKALLTDFSIDQLKKTYPKGLEKLTENTITDFDTLFIQLQQIKKTGYAYEIEESEKLIRCTAVPIRKDDEVIASMSVAFPVFRYSKEKQSLADQLLIEAKTRIEHLISMMDNKSLFSHFR